MLVICYREKETTSRLILAPTDLSATSRSCSDCNPIQNAADVPKNLARRNAVSADKLLLHFVISVSREAGMPVERDTDARLSPIGLMNSSSKISPGWTRGRYFDALMFLVVVNDSYFMLQAIFPSKDHPPLLVDSNAPESGQFPFQLFKSIARGNLKILNDTRLIDHAQLAPGSLLDIPR
jgi:hypothetical protein